MHITIFVFVPGPLRRTELRVGGWTADIPAPEGVTLIKTFNEKEKELQALGWDRISY